MDGRIGKDGAKVLQSANGKSYIRFSLANDSFVNGANKTEWFDVSCFDPYIVEKRAKYMTQGRYAIIQGVLNSEVISKNGKNIAVLTSPESRKTELIDSLRGIIPDEGKTMQDYKAERISGHSL